MKLDICVDFVRGQLTVRHTQIPEEYRPQEMYLPVATHHHWPGSRYCLQAEATFRSCSARTFADNAVGTGHIGRIALEAAGRGFISVGSSASLCALLHYYCGITTEFSSIARTAGPLLRSWRRNLLY